MQNDINEMTKPIK